MRTLVVLVIGLLATHCVAASKGIQITTQDGQQVGHYENSYALLIGVSDYVAGWPDVNAAQHALSHVESVVSKKGFEVTKVINPDGNALDDAFESFMDDYGYNENNRLLFFFSGHGYTRDNGNKGYLVPTDAPDPRVDENGFLRRAYAMTDLLALVGKIEAHHTLFLFDSCWSSTIFKTRALLKTPPHISSLTSRLGRQFITARDAVKTVPAKSVFTPAFIEALNHMRGICVTIQVNF